MTYKLVLQTICRQNMFALLFLLGCCSGLKIALVLDIAKNDILYRRSITTFIDKLPANYSIALFNRANWLLTWTNVRDYDTIQLALSQVKNFEPPNWINTLQIAEQNVPDAEIVYFIADSEPLAVPKSVIPRWNLCAVGIGLKRSTLLQLSPNCIVRDTPGALADMGVVKVQPLKSEPPKIKTLETATVIGHIYMNDKLQVKATKTRLASARGYAGVLVTIIDSAKKVFTATSDHLGEFHIGNVTPGQAQVNFTIPPGFICLLGNLSSIFHLQTTGVNRIPPLEIAIEKEVRTIDKVAAPLSGGDIAVITIGSIIGLVAILAIVACCIWRGKSNANANVLSQVRAPVELQAVHHYHHGLKQRRD